MLVEFMHRWVPKIVGGLALTVVAIVASEAAATSAPGVNEGAAPGLAPNGGKQILLAQSENPTWAHMRRNRAQRGGSSPAGQDRPRNRAEIDEMHASALRDYRNGNLRGARRTWADIMASNPRDRRAETFLEETEVEYARMLVGREEAAQAQARFEARRELMAAPVTISTDEALPLSAFMEMVSLSTPTELEYYIVEGSQTPIFASFVDRPLSQVLDTVLVPRGLSWSMGDDGLLTIQSDTVAHTFDLDADQLAKVRSLLDSGELQRLVWGQSDPPTSSAQMLLDERQRIFLVAGSRRHMAKVGEFLEAMETAKTPDLETRMYQIHQEDGPRVRALINALIASDVRTPFQLERKLFIDGKDLIVRDTPDNIVKIEELLLDDNFIQQLRSDRLNIVNFSLVPRDVENQQSDQIEIFTNRVVESIETLLYARTGRAAATSQGRRLWFDPSTLQMTVVDSPENLVRVGSFVNSLPELRQRRLQEVVFLQNQPAEELSGELLQFLGLAEGTGGGAEVTRRLRRGQSFEFRDLRIRLVRVEPNDQNDRRDDGAQLDIIRGQDSDEPTVIEGDVWFWQGYEFEALDIQASGGGLSSQGGGQGRSQNEGTIRLRIKWLGEEEGN